MKELHELKKKTLDELKDQAREINKKSRMSAGDIDSAYKLAKTYHYLCDAIKSEEVGYSQDGYSQDGVWEANMHGEYARGNSYARRRDSMGRYSRDGYSQTDYSRDGGRTKEKIERMMHEAGNEQEREALRRCMSEMR